MSEQKDLFILSNLLPRGNSERSLASLVDWFKDGQLQKPEFQRDFTWSDEQVKSWIKSIEGNQAIGVIVTYQFPCGGTIFLADGLQRLTATMRYIENPDQYGINYGSDQARNNCEFFSITLQHRHYESHYYAMEAFQKLNQGTALTPYEFYSPVLKLDGETGKNIVKTIPKIIDKYTDPFTGVYKVRRERHHTYIRDSFALFYQYITGVAVMRFWDVGTRTIDYRKGLSIEQRIVDYVSKWSIDDVNREVMKFDKYIADITALVTTKMQEVGVYGLKINVPTMRFLLHLGVWRRNTKQSVSSFDDFLEKFFVTWKPYPSISTSFPISSDPPKTTTIAMGRIDNLKMICEVIGSDLYKGKTRKKKINTRPGYHQSHIKPFSLFGDGDVFIEPALRNIARGSHPVDDIRQDKVVG